MVVIRRIADGVVAGLRALAGIGVLVAPSLLVGIWSIHYLKDCVDVLLSPGVPIKYEYDGLDGKYKFTALSYNINLENFQALLTGAQLIDPRGKQIAEVKRVEVTYDGTVRVLARNIDLRLVRNSKGNFEILQAIKKTPGPEGKTPFAVVAEHVSVHYEDQMLSPVGTLEVELPRIDLEGVGDKFIAHGEPEVVSAGKLKASLQSTPGGQFLSLASDRLVATTLLRHLQSWIPELPKLSAQSLDGKTQAVIAIPSKGPVTWQGTFDGAFAGLFVDKWTRFANGKLTFSGNQSGSNFTATAEDGGTRANVRGEILWTGPLEFRGVVKASAPSSQSLMSTMRESIPAGMNFNNGAFDGLILYRGGKLQVLGNSVADSFVVSGEQIDRVSAKLAFMNDQLYLRSAVGTYKRTPVAGALSLNFKTRDLGGFFDARAISVAAVAPDSGFSGVISVRAIISGKSDRPQAAIGLTGPITYRAPGEKRSVLLGQANARARLNGDQITIDKATIVGRNGSMVATGSVNWKTKQLSVKVQAGGIDIAAINPEVAGSAFFTGTVSGSYTDPQLKGRAELYGVEVGGKQIPVVRGTLLANQREIKFDSISVLIGATTAKGQIALNLRTRQIKGSATGSFVQLSDWLGPEIEGIATLESVLISGTVDKPDLKGLFQSSDVFTRSVNGQDINAQFRFFDNRIEWAGLTASIGGGSVTSKGAYNIKQNFLRLEELNLSKVGVKDLVGASFNVPVAGTLSGKLSLKGPTSKLASGNVDARIDGFTLGQYRVGSGSLQATVRSGKVLGGFEIGQDDRFVIGENLAFDMNSKAIEGRVDVLNVDLHTVADSILRNAKDLTPETVDLLSSIKGSTSFSALLSGESDDPTVAVNKFTATGLEESGLSVGSLEGSFNYSKRSWEVPELTWTRENSIARIKAIGNETALLSSSISIENFRSEWFADFVPGLPRVNGRFKLDFDASGEFKNLRGYGNASLTEIGDTATPDKATLPSIQIYAITLEDNVLETSGLFSASGFGGKLELKAPLQAFGIGLEKGAPRPEVVGSVVLNDRNLSEFTTQVLALDPKRAAGKVGGKLTVGGPIDSLQIDGELHIRGESLGFQKMNATSKVYEPTITALKDFDLVANLVNNQVKIVNGRTDLAAGGSVRVDAELNLEEALKSGVENLEEFLDLAKLKGAVTFTNATLAEKTPISKQLGSGVIDGIVAIGGSLRAPELSTPEEGGLRLAKLDVPTPDPFEAGNATEPIVDPVFKNIQVRLVGDARIRTTTGDLFFSGGGAINGSLSYPDAVAKFLLTKGIFSLPNARIALDPGSKIDLTYHATSFSEPIARVDIDLDGHTTVAARRLGDTIERYDVDLRIRGNLLDPKGVTLTARSDPPDLSEQEILALLGQKELIEQLASVASNRIGSTGGRGQFNQAIYGLAIPSLTNGLTRGLATSFGLDYLSVDYNAFDLATLTAAKTIGKGLTITARRQISQTPIGKLKYELKLTYRLPGKGSLFQRTRFGISTNQDLPWRLTVEYTLRY
ncbi:MAG: translocation/assembly module TamB domain-containing protein [Armatimonadetes bacterium]|nr:translocation/assembly module TamB domain-containing protein [Armatimonadota bacterium]